MLRSIIPNPSGVIETREASSRMVISISIRACLIRSPGVDADCSFLIEETRLLFVMPIPRVFSARLLLRILWERNGLAALYVQSGKNSALPVADFGTDAGPDRSAA